MDVLAVVPARSGSKGVKDKNIYPLNGRPLLSYAVATGINCPEVTETYISTDSPLYESLAIEAGARSLGLRPADLASDKAKTVDVLIDLVKQLEAQGKTFEYVVILQPTSPVRTPEDISRMLEILRQHPEAGSIASVSRLVEPHPYKLKKINDDGYLLPFIEGTSSEIPRQELPPAYKLNGALYIIRTAFMLETGRILSEKTLPYEMEEGVNIDSPNDLLFLEFLLKTNKLSL